MSGVASPTVKAVAKQVASSVVGVDDESESTPPSESSIILRSDGTSRFLRPDGTSEFVRP